MFVVMHITGLKLEAFVRALWPFLLALLVRADGHHLRARPRAVPAAAVLSDEVGHRHARDRPSGLHADRDRLRRRSARRLLRTRRRRGRRQQRHARASSSACATSTSRRCTGTGARSSLLGHALRDCRSRRLRPVDQGRPLPGARRATGQAAAQRGEGAAFNPVLDYSREGALRSLEQSMLRLGRRASTSCYIHDVDAHSQGSEEAAEAAFSRRAAWRAAGAPRSQARRRDPRDRRRHQPAGLGAALAGEADLDLLMLAGRLTLLNREAEADVLGECRRRASPYVAAGAFNGGLLARGSRARSGGATIGRRPRPSCAYELAFSRSRAAWRRSKGGSDPVRAAPPRRRVAGDRRLDAGGSRGEPCTRAVPIPESFWREAG